MKKSMRLWKVLICFVLLVGVFFQGSLRASAINTVFMVPPINKDYVHHNTLYLSPNYNISACQWGYGTTVDILNTTGNVDGLLAEVFANVTPTGGQRIMGFYMEGAGFSAANAADIVANGWAKVEMYYETFMVSCTPAGAMRPNIEIVENEQIGNVLNGAGFTEQFAVMEVTEVNSSWAYLLKYDESFSFLRGTDVHVYKFQPDLGVFLPVQEVYFDSYDRNFLEWDNPELVDPVIDGLYVAVGQALPEELVYTTEAAAELRANPPLIPNTEGTVQWKMAPGLVPENFTAEAVVAPVDEAEVSVDFAYSGELPEGTEVTVQIPQETVTYTDGMELFLYFCNPENEMREFVSSGTYQEQQVTFAIEHCSAYVITSEDHGESYMPEPEIVEPEPEPEVETVEPEESAEEPEETPVESETEKEVLEVPTEEVGKSTVSVVGVALAAVVVLAVAAVAVVLIKKKKK